MCPNKHILKSFKIHPRLIHFDYHQDKYFIYVYLNPFKDIEPLEVDAPNQRYCFGYEPLYVGKGTGAGYRHNQHITEYLNSKEGKASSEGNKYKKNWFEYLEKEMHLAKMKKDSKKPWDWNEYKKSYVVVLCTFKTSEELLDFEVKLIQKIGTIKKGTGPLVNIIYN